MLAGVVALALFAAGCGGSSESEELAQTRAELAQIRAELDALKEQIAGRTHQTPTTLATRSTLLMPGMDGFTGEVEEFMTRAERREWIRANPLIGLPWRDAEKIARDAGWSIKVIFAENDLPEMTMEMVEVRLRLVVVGGEEAGTVVRVVNA